MLDQKRALELSLSRKTKQFYSKMRRNHQHASMAQLATKIIVSNKKVWIFWDIKEKKNKNKKNQTFWLLHYSQKAQPVETTRIFYGGFVWHLAHYMASLYREKHQPHWKTADTFRSTQREAGLITTGTAAMTEVQLHWELQVCSTQSCSRSLSEQIKRLSYQHQGATTAQGKQLEFPVSPSSQKRYFWPCSLSQK